MTLSFSYSFLSQDENCPEAARHLFVLRDFKKSWTTAEGIDIHKLLEQRLKAKQPLPDALRHAEPMVLSIEKHADKPIEVEVSYAVDRNLQPTGFWTGYLRGKYDVVVRYPQERRACILDWKSGKVRESSDQLELGALLLMANDPQIDQVSGVNAWLQKETIGTTYTFKRTEKGPLWAKWLARMNAIEKRDASVEWEKREGPLCAYCPVKTCTYYRGG